MRDGRTVSREAFLASVHSLAARLPDRAQVVNYCADRLNFVVALGAALVRGQVTHLPHDRTPHALNELTEKHGDIYCLVDGGPHPDGLDCVTVGPLDHRPYTPQEAPEFPGEQVAAVVYTGGTSGRPTPNVKSWGALVNGAVRIAEAFGLEDGGDETIVATVPPQHMYGLELSVMVPLARGLALHAGRPFYPGDVEASVREIAGPVVLVTTPVHLKALASAHIPLTGLTGIVSATAPLPVALAEEVERRFGAPVFEIYGCSETGSLAARRTVDGSRWRTLRDLEVRQHEGEVYGHVPYLPAPVRLHDVIDVLSATEFTLCGRSDDMVNVAGKRASLSGLNAILNEIPGVDDGAFFHPEDGVAGEDRRLGAFVVAPGLSEGEVRSRLRDRIDSAFQPRPLHLVSSLPRSPTGKLTRAALADLARRAREGRR